MQIDIKLDNNGIMPTKEFEASAGYDLYIPNDIIVPKGRSIIPLNFRIALPEGYGAYIFGRSGMTAKGMKGYNIYDNESESRFDCNVNLGLVDCGYRGVVGILVQNNDMQFKLKRGDSVAQMVILKSENAEFVQVESLDNTERGEQGFNS